MDRLIDIHIYIYYKERGFSNKQYHCELPLKTTAILGIRDHDVGR